MPTLTADGSQLLNVAHTFTTGYNGDGQIVSAGDSALGHAVSQYAIGYDGDGRVKTVDNAGTAGVPDVVLTSGYNVMGDRTSLSATIAGAKDFLNNYSYDALAQMTSETQQGQSGGNAVATKGISFGHDAIGDITSIARYTNLTQPPSPVTDAADTTLGYSSLGQLTSIVHSHNGSTIEGLGYGYDTLSRVDSISSTIDGGTALGYDVNSQLVSATYTGNYPPPNDNETYDKNGNRTNAGYTIGTDNEITSDGVFNYGHDGEGNVTSRTRMSTSYASDHNVVYDWDFRNRLTDAYFYDNNGMLTKQVHDVYDVFDELIEQDVETFGSGASTQTVHHVWDGEGIVLDFNGQSQLTERYLNGPNTTATDSVFSTLAEEQVNSLTSAGTVTFNLLDHLGSTVDVVDSSGVLQDHIDYDVFGQVAHETNSAIHHLTGFAGGLPDPNTGLVLFGHRWYDAAHAVWMSPDPIGFLGGDPDEQRYAGNDPANETDPSGLAGEHWFNNDWHDWVNPFAYVGAIGYAAGDRIGSGYSALFVKNQALSDEVARRQQTQAVQQLRDGTITTGQFAERRLQTLKAGLEEAADDATAIIDGAAALVELTFDVVTIVDGAIIIKRFAQNACGTTRLVSTRAAGATAKDASAKMVAHIVDPQLDANILIALGNPSDANHAAAVAYATANKAAGLSVSRSAYMEYLVKSSKAQFDALRQRFGLRLIRELTLDELKATASRLQRAFVDGRILKDSDARAAAAAFLKNERVATADLQFFKRARDLGLNVEFVGTGKAAKDAAAYACKPVAIPAN